MFVEFKDFLIPRDKGIAIFDGLYITQHGFGRHSSFARNSEMPLQIANPQNQLCNRRCARVDLDTKEIFGCNRVAAHFRYILLVAQFDQQRDDFAFKLLHPRQRNIEEIACAAGRVKNFGLR